MNHSRKKSFSALVMTGVALVFCCLILLAPVGDAASVATVFLGPAVTKVELRDIPGSSIFNQDIGIYLCRPEETSRDIVYHKSISTSDLISNKTEFYPLSYQALKRRDDAWEEIPNSEDFWVEADDSTNYSVRWYLNQDAPAAVYGVRCIYKEVDDDGVPYEDTAEFQVIYTEYWTYINVTNKSGARRMKNFAGGRNMTLDLDITFNDGAADPGLFDSDLTAGSTGVLVGALSNTSDIVSTAEMDIAVKSVSGDIFKPWEDFTWEPDGIVANRYTLQFTNYLRNDIYLVQFTSQADSRIIGQFIIDNTGMDSGVTLSQFWAILMIVGGVLAFGAASAYLVPFLMVKVNEARVYKENEQVARMKNPENYADKKKTSFKEKISKLIYNIKTPAYKRQKENQPEEKPVEEKVYTNRFTEMLRERQEKRDFMQEHNVTSAEMERMKEAEAAAAADEANSFAFLRNDDDDEIATFHAAEDEVSTIETGSYTEGGTTFAKLDSLRDEEPPHDGATGGALDNGSYGGNGF